MIALHKIGDKLVVNKGEAWEEEIHSNYTIDVKINYDDALEGTPIKSIKVNGEELVPTACQPNDVETGFIDESGELNTLITQDLTIFRKRILIL